MVVMAGLWVPAVQITAAQQLFFGVAEPNGHAFLFFAGEIGMSEGLVIYRTDGGEEIRVTREPIRPATRADEFFAESGADPQDLVRALDVNSPVEAFLRLRLDRTVGTAYAIADPPVARALGRLWVDSTSTVGQNATYRLEVVNGFDEPTDQTYSVSILPTSLVPPVEPSASYQKSRIVLTWSHVTALRPDDDPVTTFYVYEEIDGVLLPLDETRTFRQIGLVEHATSIPALAIGTRTFRIASSDFAGRQSAPGEAFSVEVVDDIPPPSVTGIEAAALSSRSVAVNWAYAGEQVSFFEILRSREVRGEYTLVGATSDSAGYFLDETVEPGNVYHFQVSAVDSAGNKSERTLTGSVLVEDYEAPPTPSGLTAEVGEGTSVRLAWNPVEAADLNTYVVLRRRITKGRLQPYANVNQERVLSPSFVDAGPTGLGFEVGAMYEFGVVAADSSANFSDTSTVTIQIPDAVPPVAPTAVASYVDGVVTVNWNPSPSRDVVTYELSREDQANVAKSTLAFPRGVTTYVDREAIVGNTYVYAVAAVDSLGNKSAASMDTLYMRQGPPRRVRNVTATYANGSVVVAWSAPEAGSDSAFRIYRSSSDGPFESVGEVTGARTFVDVAGEAGSNYYVTGVTADGREGARSTYAVATSES
jgi:fibronectin type 3 domain-containing protein